MTTLRTVLSRVVGAIFWRRRDAVLDQEIQTHLDLLTEAHLRRGLSLADARAAARREFGGIDQMKEVYRDQRGIPLMSAIVQDVRFGLRLLRKSPGFTLVAVASLALGIGANTAIFSVANAALLKDLPVRDPDTLASVAVVERGSRRGSLSYPMFRDVASRQQVFSELSASGGMSLDRVRMEGVAEDIEGVDGAFVSANYFTMLGVRAAVGRLFTTDDSRRPGEGAVAVLGCGFWERQFVRDPSVIGRTVTLNRAPFTIIGVAERGFFGDRVGAVRDIWVPILMQPRVQSRDMLERRTATWFRTIGRMKAGVDVKQASAELTALVQGLKAEEIAAGSGSLISRSQPSDFRVELETGSRGLNILRQRLRQHLGLLMAVVGLVLLIACCNVANLLLARATARRREMAIRLALGSSRRRIVAQLLTESLLLALAGAALGLVLARWVSVFLTRQVAIAVDATPDARVLAFTLAVAVLTAVLFGWIPALQATALDPGRALASASAREAGSRPRKRVSKMLVASQVALSVWLLVGAGLLLQTLRNLKALDIGLERGRLLTVDVMADPYAIPNAQLPELRRRIVDGLQRIPGVASVGFSDHRLFSGSATTAPVRVPGSGVNPERDGEVRQEWVSSGYFSTVGMRLTMGRGFEDSDSAVRARVTVINETMARHYFGADSPLGRMIYFPRIDAKGRYIPFTPQLDTAHGVEVVGVVEDAKYDDLRSATPRMAYLPIPAEIASLGYIEVRVDRHPSQVAPLIRPILNQIDPRLVLRRMATLEEQIDLTLGQERLLTGLLGGFGGLALALACVGIYGVTAYSASGRTSEIGIRMALGASRAEVVTMVLKETLVPVAAGVALGIPAAMASTHLLRTLLFGLEPHDPATLSGVSILMLVVAALAGYFPARRAARVDPVAALRYD